MNSLHHPSKIGEILPGGIQNGCHENGSRWSCDIQANMVRDTFPQLEGVDGDLAKSPLDCNELQSPPVS